jgi:hypothetical protein
MPGYRTEAPESLSRNIAEDFNVWSRTIVFVRVVGAMNLGKLILTGLSETI